MRKDICLAEMAAAALAALALAVGCASGAHEESALPPAKIESFCYYFGDDVDECVAADVDMIILDPYFMSAGDVERIRKSGKTVLAYINAGAIETWREGVWRSDWRIGSPAFLLAAYPGWDDEVLVDVTDDAWREILFRWMDDELAKGADGVFLDNVAEGYSYKENGHPDFPVGRDEAREYVAAIRDHIGRGKLLFVNQGLEILDDSGNSPGSLRFIDGIMQEDLFYSADAKALRPDGELSRYYDYLDPVLAAGKVVLVVDYPYPDHPELADLIIAKGRAKGYLTYVADMKMETIYE